MAQREDIEKKVAMRLKELRRQRRLTLQEFEEFSHGEIKAVVIGSYERGTRSISLSKIVQLAKIYGVPVEYFFDDGSSESNVEVGRIVFDLRRIRAVHNLDATFLGLENFLERIATRRRDWNGEVLSLRASDRELLEIITGLPSRELIDSLSRNNLLFQKA